MPEFNAGAMENAGAVTFLEDYVFRSKVTRARYERRAETILHEMAHMWFGDLVTMRWWDDLWLNESFATYISTLCQAEATEFTTAWTTFANTEKAWAYAQDQLPSTHPIAADIPDVAAVEVNFDGITYAKGASVLKQLVAYVGPDEFLAGVRRYFRKHAYGNTTLADLLGAAGGELRPRPVRVGRAVAADRQVNTLRPVFELDRRRPVRRASPSSRPPSPSTRCCATTGSRSASTATGPTGSPARARVELDVAGARTEVPELVGHPAADLVLVNDDDLTYAKLRLDERSLATLRTRIGAIPDPLARALCWSAAWDMTRDAELPARDYVAAGARRRGRRDRDQRRPVAARPGADRADLLRRPGVGARPAGRMLADHALAALEAAPAGSDVQLQWSRTFASAARTDEHAAVLRGLLDGSRHARGPGGRRRRAVGVPRPGWSRSAPPATPRSTPRRSGTRPRPACAGRPPRGRCGRRRSRRRRPGSGPSTTTTCPTPCTRRCCWASGTRPSASSPPGYVERYFAEIRPLWDRRPGEIAKNAVQYLFPPVVEPRTIVAADAWLADAGPARRRCAGWSPRAATASPGRCGPASCDADAHL